MIRRTILAAVLAAALLPATGVAEEPATGPVFDFALQDINPNSATFGEVLRLSDLYADRGVLLNFMASWCRPCRQELPELQSIHAQDGATIVAVAADEYGGPEGLEPLFDATNLTFPVLFAPEPKALEIAEHYPYRIIPATYIIDSGGIVRSHYQGLKSRESLWTEIDRHLAGSAN